MPGRLINSIGERGIQRNLEVRAEDPTRHPGDARQANRQQRSSLLSTELGCSNDTMHIHPATMTGILDRLEDGGWVIRQRAPDDRRKVHLRALRSRGPELVRLYAPMNESLNPICAELTVDELRTVAGFLRSVSEAATAAVSQLKQRSHL